MMAAAEMAADSSGSDDEVLKRCREAVWETPNQTKDVDKVKESKRLVVSKHDHDGNELQVTQGFQTHVAKKLSHFLDSQISELQFETSSAVKPAKSGDDDDDDDDDDDGDDEVFRLFSTSVPTQKVEDPPPPVHRRPVPSSSDSDSEMELRFKEAAVSFKDLVTTASRPDQHAPPTEELINTEVVKKKKKKKKKKVSEVEVGTHDKQEQDKNSTDSLNSHGNNVHSEQDKRKKKKRQKTEEVL